MLLKVNIALVELAWYVFYFTDLSFSHELHTFFLSLSLKASRGYNLGCGYRLVLYNIKMIYCFYHKDRYYECLLRLLL